MRTLHLLLLISFLTLLKISAVAQHVPDFAESQVSSKRSAVASVAHQALMNQYDVTFYKLDLHLERNSTYVAGNVTIVAEPRAAGFNVFAFELHPNFQIDSVVVNGNKAQNISRNNSDVSVTLPTTLTASDKISSTIYYKGTAPSDASAAIGNGFSTATETNWGNQVTWSLSEPYAAYEWWPTKQVLTDKADSVYVFITTSADNKVGSNGLLTRTVDLPNGKRRFEWKSRYPIAYYLISVAVSNYDEYLIYANPQGASSPVPILNYVYRGSLAAYKEQIDFTAPLIEHFSELFTLYPFVAEKYGHGMAPIGGGMEHQTMTTQSTFTFTLTAHELAHQWFGDNVTCASWSDIWLNEGFASYAEYLALQQFMPEQANDWIVSAQDMALQYPEGSLFVTDTTNVSRIFNYRLSYKKGAAVVHMLRYTINNDSLFFQALQNYQQQFSGRTATTADLQRVLEETRHIELDYFFEQWYKGGGAPAFSVVWNQEGSRVLLLSEQTTSSGSTPFFTTDVEYSISTTIGDTVIRLPHHQPTEQYLLQLNGMVTNVTFDPNNWLLNYTLQVSQNPDLVVPEAKAPVLYPNPASTYLKVHNLDFTPTFFAVYDSTGKLTKSQRLNSEAEINIEELSAGYYILQLSNDKQRYRQAFVKIR